MAWSDWSTNPALNATQPGINWAEGMQPKDINGSARQMMADLASYMQSTLKNTYDVTRWGVLGGLANAAADTAAINLAIQQVPIGCTLVFPGALGTVYVTDTIVHNRAIDISFERGAIVYGYFNDVTKDVWSVKVTDAGGPGDVRLMSFYKARIGCFPGKTCHDTVHVENVAPLASNLNMSFWDCDIYAEPTQAGSALRFKGLVTQLHKVIGGQYQNQINIDGAADGCRIVYAQIFGVKTGIILQPAQGAFRTCIAHNVIVCQNGAIAGDGMSECDILYNQIEQSGVNASPAQSLIYLGGFNYGSRRNNILGNNLGGGSTRAIYLDGDLQDTLIDNNTFGLSTSGVDIVILNSTGKTANTRIGPNNQVRNNRGGVVITDPPGSASANTVDPASLLSVFDNGVGTYGVRKAAVDVGAIAGIGLSNGWGQNAGFYYEKSLEERMFFNSSLAVGVIAAGTLIGTFHLGFRPLQRCVMLVPDLATGLACSLEFNTDGTLKVLSVAAGTVPGSNLDFTAVSVSVKGRDSYDPNV